MKSAGNVSTLTKAEDASWNPNKSMEGINDPYQPPRSEVGETTAWLQCFTFGILPKLILSILS